MCNLEWKCTCLFLFSPGCGPDQIGLGHICSGRKRYRPRGILPSPPLLSVRRPRLSPPSQTKPNPNQRGAPCRAAAARQHVSLPYWQQLARLLLALPTSQGNLVLLTSGFLPHWLWLWLRPLNDFFGLSWNPCVLLRSNSFHQGLSAAVRRAFRFLYRTLPSFYVGLFIGRFGLWGFPGPGMRKMFC